jgi:hypothetical protein
MWRAAIGLRLALLSKHLPSLSYLIPILDSSAAPRSLAEVIHWTKCFGIVATVSDALTLDIPVVTEQPKTMNKTLHSVFPQILTTHRDALAFGRISGNKVTG